MVAVNNINNTIKTDFTNAASLSGGSIATNVTNSSNTSSSTATSSITVGGASAGDARQTFAIESGVSWSLGLDNSDADSFVISSGSVLGTNNCLKVLTTGEITRPLQPAFLASKGTTQTDVTGNGTVVSVSYTTEITDIGGVFASSTFTAPIDGKYIFAFGVRFGDLDANATALITSLVTSNRKYTTFLANGANLLVTNATTYTNQVGVTWMVICEMEAADTATVECLVDGVGADTVDVIVDGNSGPYFGGALMV